MRATNAPFDCPRRSLPLSSSFLNVSLRPKSTVRMGTVRKSMDVPLLPARQFACNKRVRRAGGVKLSGDGSFNLATVVWESEKDKRIKGWSFPFPLGAPSGKYATKLRRPFGNWRSRWGHIG
jgi:hypothetical protein